MFNFSICFFLKNGIKAALVQGLLAQNVKENQRNYDITKKIISNKRIIFLCGIP